MLPLALKNECHWADGYGSEYSPLRVPCLVLSYAHHRLAFLPAF